MRTEAQLVDELRSKVGKQTELARRLGISPQYLHDVLKGVRPISERVAKAMGYTRKVVFVRAK